MMKMSALFWMTVLILLPAFAAAADFDGDGREDIAVFRPDNGLWAVRGITRFFFGRDGDLPQPDYYSGGNGIQAAIFRASSGLWAVRGLTRVYFGRNGDIPRPGDYSGGGSAEIAVYRAATGLWAVRGMTRIYYGQPGDRPIQGGVGQRLYDYVIKSGDGDDLAAGLQNPVYGSVFIPRGDYAVQSDIRVNGVKLISGAGRENTRIMLNVDCHIFLETAGGVTLENISIWNGGEGDGQIQVGAAAAQTGLSNVNARNSAGHGFAGSGGADEASFVNCQAISAAGHGFYRFPGDSGFVNCIARDCGGIGFHTCDNLANCLADGGGTGSGGFYRCNQMANCSASGSFNGVNDCHQIAASESIGNTNYGFADCSYVSASYAASNGIDWFNCTHTAAGND
jgi:hypothetical protein